LPDITKIKPIVSELRALGVSKVVLSNYSLEVEFFKSEEKVQEPSPWVDEPAPPKHSDLPESVQKAFSRLPEAYRSPRLWDDEK
jgi:hypothetical protein